MAGSTLDDRISDGDIVSEKHVVEEKVVDSPPSEVDQGIVKDWDGEEAAVMRKSVAIPK
jgi:hypothetical protein